ncbi:MAG: sensor histidine kinase, partial [Pseudomonadota bacterium]
IAAAMAAFVAILLFFAWRAQRKAARTRATLLAEIHHRTKNNLQFITSLLNMDARRQRKNPSHAASPEDAAHRVQAMALLHDRLYAETDGHSVNLHEFLRAMLQQVEASFGRDDVEGTLNAPDIHLTPDTSAPMGLLVCELVLNAYKHAFPDRGGAILVEIEERGRELVLTVTDDGCGAKDGLRDGSVGMTLIEDLVAQLKGTAKMESGDWGTRWTISGIPAKRAVETV